MVSLGHNELSGDICFSYTIDGAVADTMYMYCNPQTTCFNNQTVETAVLEALKELGVEVHSGYLLAQWNEGRGGEIIESAGFTSNTKPLTLECSVSVWQPGASFTNMD